MKSKLKKVIRHVKGDIKDWKHEEAKDKMLLRDLKKKPSKHEKHEKKESAKHEKMEEKKSSKTGRKAVDKFKKVMHEFKEGKLHSGSKKGPLVTNPKQAVAISYSEDRRVRKAAKKRK